MILSVIRSHCGDGLDIPPFIIGHTYKNASKVSGRRCKANENPIKGMNKARMKDYVDDIAQYVTETSLLVMDRLSSHTALEVRHHLLKKKTQNGDPLFILLFLPAKTAFLISPLDMGAIGAFKSYFHKLDRSSVTLKVPAVHEAWRQVSNDALVNRTFYDAWNSGSIEVQGAKRHRGVRLIRPSQPPEGHLDGLYWTNFGGNK